MILKEGLTSEIASGTSFPFSDLEHFSLVEVTTVGGGRLTTLLPPTESVGWVERRSTINQHTVIVDCYVLL